MTYTRKPAMSDERQSDKDSEGCVRERIMIKARVMVEEKTRAKVGDEMGFQVKLEGKTRRRPRRGCKREATQIRKDREVASSQHFHHTRRRSP